jgi:hypothetical protein
MASQVHPGVRQLETIIIGALSTGNAELRAHLERFRAAADAWGLVRSCPISKEAVSFLSDQKTEK